MYVSGHRLGNPGTMSTRSASQPRFLSTIILYLCIWTLAFLGYSNRGVAADGRMNFRLEDKLDTEENLFRVDYSYNDQLLSQLRDCDVDSKTCDLHLANLIMLSAKVTNEHNVLMVNDRAQQLFEDILYFLGTSAPQYRAKVCHILSTIQFSNGNVRQSETYHSCMNKTDLLSLRSMAAHLMISGSPEGQTYLQEYANLLEKQFIGIVNSGVTHNRSTSNDALTEQKTVSDLAKRPLDRNAEDFILTFLLSETQGGIRTSVRLVDLVLSLTNMTGGFDENFRFRLGVGLAKLGLHDLSVKQVSLAARQWESPLYRLRAKLVFPPVHASIGALAAAVNNFERQMESILLQDIPQTDSMTQVCNSLSEAALALQALPLLHLIGFSAPRVANGLGHLPVPLPILLGEVYLHMCPLVVDASYDADPLYFRDYMIAQPPALTKHSLLSRDISSSLEPSSIHTVASRGNGGNSGSDSVGGGVGGGASSDGGDSTAAAAAAIRSGHHQRDGEIAYLPTITAKTAKRKLHIGIVAGSFDSLPGRIMIGLLDTFPDKMRKLVEFTAMCFPTPRSAVTDRVNALFDHHINLSTDNKTQILQRIHQAHIDFILFADAAMDARVFALAQERLALYQGMLWSWGGTLGIRNVDYYFVPEIFLQHSRCRASSTGLSAYRRSHQIPKVLPQQHFTEQVIWLEGMPELMPRTPSLRMEEAMGLFMQRYLLDLSNRTHIYLFPASVKHWHPEFDRAVEVIFRTDPLAMVVLAVVKSGRDTLPTTHLAVTHDLLHPAMPLAGVHKLQQRIRSHVQNQHLFGTTAAGGGTAASASTGTGGTTSSAGPSPFSSQQGDRLRVLPPLDEAMYRALLRHSVAVLDPFPVGLHTVVLEAMLDGVPVISAPALQECTNSHVYSLAKYMHIMPSSGASGSGSSGGGGGGGGSGGGGGGSGSGGGGATAASSSSTTSSRGGDRASSSSSTTDGSTDHSHVWSEKDFFPVSAEEYGVLAVRVAKDAEFRKQFVLHQETIVYHPEIYHTITIDHAAQHHELLPMALHAQQYFALPGTSGAGGGGSGSGGGGGGVGSTAASRVNGGSSGVVGSKTTPPHRPTHLEQIVAFVQQLLVGELTDVPAATA